MDDRSKTLKGIINLGLVAFFLFFTSLNPCLSVEKNEFLILFTGEDLGHLEPCGCSTGQLGGLPRRHSWIDHMRKEGTEVLLLSNGDLIQERDRLGEIKFETTLQAMNLMGYHVMNVGEKDLSLGIEYLKSLQDSASFKMISSNLRDGEGQALFENVYHHEIKIGEARFSINILAILSPEFQEEVDPSLRILDPKAVLEKLWNEDADLMSDMRSHNFWILLFHGELNQAIEIAKVFPKIDMIITGHEIDGPDQKPVRVGNTLIMVAPVKGKYLGKIILGKVKVGLKAATFKILIAPLGSGHVLRTPKGLVLESTTEKVTTDSRPWLLPLDDKFSFRIKDAAYIELTEEMGSSEKAENLLNEYQSRLKQEGLFQDLSQRLKSAKGNYVGSEACQPCHVKAFTTWQEARHPHAYESLIPAKREYDPDCLTCHSTGFKYISGFLGIDKTPHLSAVGCESCHGAGSKHIRNPVMHRMDQPGSGTCMGCHDTENSPQFDFEKYWEKIRH